MNILRQQLQTGRIEMPSTANTVRARGTVDITLEDRDVDCKKEEETTTRSGLNKAFLHYTRLTFHKLPGGTQDSYHELPRGRQDSINELPSKTQDSIYELPSGTQDSIHELPSGTQNTKL